MAKTTVEGNELKIKDPKFLSLVGKPANKVAFRVVRSDDTDQPTGDTTMKPVIVRRARRTDTSPILRMTFPVAYTDEQVAQQMATFGLTGYDVSRSDTAVVAVRSDLKSISNSGPSTSIRLTADGIVAEVAKIDTSDGNPKSQIAVASLVFRADKFTPDTIKLWLDGNKISAGDIAAPEGDGDYIVQRQEIPEGEETRKVELADGVSATIIRSDCCDIPDGFVAVVNETAYGNWGWGQLDFMAAMADEEFSEAMDEALYRLKDVLRNILLYSSLPLAERKVLMVNALAQFQAFSTGILDSLPRTVLVAVARSASPQPEKESMNKTPDGGVSTNTPAAPTPETPITRAELAAMIDEAIAKRAAPAAAAPAAEPKAAEPAAPAASTAITRDDLAAAMTAAVKPLVDRIEKVEGTTVARSDAGDGEVAAMTAKAGEDTKTKDVFRGSPLFNGLGVRRTA